MPSESTVIQVPPSYVEAAVTTIDEEARTVELVFSTGATFARYDWRTGRPYNLRFSLQRGHVRLNRLNNGAPLLNAHSSWNLSHQVGVVVEKSAAVDGKEARCTVRFSRREEVEAIWQDVRDGIIRNVSVGATIHKFEEKRGADEEVPLRTAVDWEPFEVSLVPIGADDGAKVKATDQIATNPCVVVTHPQESQMSDHANEGFINRLRSHFNDFFDKATVAGEPSAPTPPAPTPPVERVAADAKAVVRMCHDAGHPLLAGALLDAEATVAEVEAAIARAKQITDLCATAKLPELAASYIEGGMGVDTIRGQLATFAAKADGTQINGQVDPEAQTSKKPRIDYAEVYGRLNGVAPREQ